MLNSKNIKIVLFLLLSVSVVFIYFTQSYNSVTSIVFKREDEASFISRNVLTEEKENTWRENPRPQKQLNITTVVEDNAQLSNEIGVQYILEKKLALALADSGEIDLDIGEPDLGETDEPMDTDIPVLSHPVTRRLLNKDDFNQLMKGRQVHLQKSCQNIFKQQRQESIM
ncbi:uncharacterized protein LOC111706394 isoform X2 [Eurytemora carolleeae]|uniref:uncharacterized protein LOC111706394 isoform X2 n=1 Tax=Eurytemora carolleeae TaxID=1294199 RepID=UPI000C77D49C|nr:uncharacterized protein LOC111706394 isoform X2 [Eurytemora carolleeae]|eukprot:XP_023335030.1 uncharacterized protein LOC111706394 isoform X2 [Eurytemora affinis]